jgi:ABC-type nitrate/sulfonate/bicarbonate transport system permease component
MELTRQPTAEVTVTAGADAPAAAAVPAPSRRARSRRRGGGTQRLLIGGGTTIALLALWELLARTGVLPDEVPPFTDIVGWLVGQLGESAFWTSLRLTLWHWFAGLVVGGAIGIVVGVAIGLVPFIQRLLNLPLELLRPIPAIVYLPLLILTMGSRSQTAIVLSSLGAFWPMLFQSIYGVRAIDAQSVETGKVFGLTTVQRLWYIQLRSVLPYLATGVRISSSLALIVAVSAELVGGVPGIGADIANASTNGLYDAMYGLLIVSGILGLALNVVLERTERRLLSWHVSHRVVST